MDMISAINKATHMTTTTNGAVAYDTTFNAVLDLFALGAAYRNRTVEDCINLFSKALHENESLAMKCLFWIRDCRGGAGERRFFRVCMKWLTSQCPEVVRRNLPYFPEYGRWDDVFCLLDTSLEEDALIFVADQLFKDFSEIYPSLCAKWAPSCNASSNETKRKAQILRKHMGLTEKAYRYTLSKIRERLRVLERLMSGKRWDEIDFNAIPSQAGIKYSKCFANREELKERYAEFMKRDDTKVNAAVLYPYECLKKARYYSPYSDTKAERDAINKYWTNLPNYVEGPEASNYLAVVDTSGSMLWSHAHNIAPMDVAVSLGIYFAERAKGPFHNKYISFSSRPQLIDCTGTDFVDKARRIATTNLCENTDLNRVFDMLLDIAKSGQVSAEDFVKKLFIISDMGIDQAQGHYDIKQENSQYLNSQMEKLRYKWEHETCIPFPKLVYWNVNAANNTILECGPDVSYVSGASPSILKQVLTGKTNWELCLETINSPRYDKIH